MSESINTGGAAFPGQSNGLGQSFAVEEANRDGQRYIVVHDPGMSLRDWFAGMALQGLLAVEPSDCGSMEFAKSAYEMADAMIEMRTKP